MNNLQSLLKDVSAILTKHAEISKATSGDFNVFKITDTGTDERIMCRMLYELLNPKGSHGQGDTYLELFMKNVLRLDKSAKNAKVAREYNADGRFIDLVIELPNLFIPLEVKIWAGDQSKQLFDYYSFAKKKNSGTSTKVYYLTIDGTAPSSESKEDLSDKDIVCLSWKDDIKNWLDSCLSTPETIRLAPIREVLLQFKQAILKFTGQVENKVMKEIVQLLSNSEQNMRSAKAVVDAFTNCKTQLVKKFFNALHEKINEEFKGQCEEITTDSDYDISKTPYPGMSFDIKRKAEDIDFIFGIGVESSIPLFVGFGYMKNGERIADNEMSKNLRKYFRDIDGTRCTPYFIFFEHIIFENEKISLMNFNDDNSFKLFDSAKFDEIIDSTVEQAKMILKKLR